MRFTDFFKVVPQYILPQQLLSKGMHWFMHIRQPWIKNTTIKLMTKAYKIDVSEAEDEDFENYPHFNAFFTTNWVPVQPNPVLSRAPDTGNRRGAS